MSLLSINAQVTASFELASLLVRHRQLTWEMTKREITDRYAGQMLGAIWVIGLPLLLMGLYVFIFTYVFPARVEASLQMPRSLTVYILCGLVPWLTFAEAMNKGTGVIVEHAGLVKQVVFPIEILPVKSVLASFATQLVASTVLLLYMAVEGGGYPWTLIMLPMLFFFQLMAMAGVCFALSSVGVFVRDLREVVQVFTTAGLFLAPILYQPEMVERIWPPFKVVLTWNDPDGTPRSYEQVLYGS